MTNEYKIGWVLGFGACANWEITPVSEREYDEVGNCINGARVIGPGHLYYQNPFDAFEEHFGEKFVLDSPQNNVEWPKTHLTI